MGDRAAVCVMRAGEADLPEILAVQKRAFASEAERYGDPNLPPLRETLDEIREQLATHVVLKAVWDCQIVGSVRGHLEAGSCHVTRLAVRPDVQGRGIGSLLVGALEEQFPNAESFVLFTGHKSHRTIALYERLGYRVTHSTVESDRVTLVHMAKHSGSERPGAERQG